MRGRSISGGRACHHAHKEIGHRRAARGEAALACARAPEMAAARLCAEASNKYLATTSSDVNRVRRGRRPKCAGRERQAAAGAKWREGAIMRASHAPRAWRMAAAAAPMRRGRGVVAIHHVFRLSAALARARHWWLHRFIGGSGGV